MIARPSALRVLTLLLLAGLFATACGASRPPERATALLTIVPPELTGTTNAAIIDGDHVVFTPVDYEAAAAQRVYVHLTETNTTPTAADPMWGAMANAGARVIVLAYDSLVNPDAQCEQDCLPHDEEFETGAQHIPEVLAALLRHLDQSAPADGWGPFLTSEQDGSLVDTIAWDKVILAGHRSGADKAAYLGAIHPADRIVLFAGPVDQQYFGEPKTSTDERFIAFANAKEDLATQTVIWEAVGVPASETRLAANDDLEDPRSLDFSRLISELEPIDGFNPRNDWQHRRYQAIWEYVCCE